MRIRVNGQKQSIVLLRTTARLPQQYYSPMGTLSIRSFQRGQVLTAVSNQRYTVTDRASTHHPHIWLARSESDGGQFIIKSPLRDHGDDQRRAMRQLNTEISILTGPLKNTEGIRQLVNHVILAEGPDEQVRAGVFEYFEVDLHRCHLDQKRSISRPQIKSIAQQILRALSSAHKQKIVHTDLKPENIVFSRLGSSTGSGIQVKLIDFGVASQQDDDRKRRITNPYWRSPESWVEMPWGPPADIWSFGAMIGSLLMEPGAKLFQPMGGLAGGTREEKDREFLRSIWTILPFPKSFLARAPTTWQSEISRFAPRLAPTGAPTTLSFIGDLFEVPEADWAFVRDVLEVDPDQRPTADEPLRHSWLE